MNKKFGWILGTLVIAVIAVGAFGASVAYADDGGPGQRQGRFDGEALDTIADLLGMSADEVTAALEDGQTIQDLADEAGVDMEEIKAAMSEIRNAWVQERIQTALEEGNLTQDEADWLFEGLDNGYLAKLGKFFSRHSGRYGHGGFDGQNASPQNDL